MLRTRSTHVRHATPNGSASKIGGLAVPYNQWAEINSRNEGHFLEQFAPGAFAKSIREDRDQIRLLFMHGQDAVVGLRPIGSIDELRETAAGLEFEATLLGTSFAGDIAAGIEKRQYGMSVSFQVRHERPVSNPRPSPDNPKGLPTRIIFEARLHEFSVVTWGAYAGAHVGLRGWLPQWYLGPSVPRQTSYLPEPAVRSGRPSWDLTPKQSWRLGQEPWRLPGTRKKPSWWLGDWPPEKKPAWRDR
jgi:HK97 family phage prohead protease